MHTEIAAETSGALRAAARALARVLFPSQCLAGCGRSLDRVLEGGVCPSCWEGLESFDGTRCRTCDEPMPGEGEILCGRCVLLPPAFSTLRGAAPYRGTARAILLAFKFRGADYLAGHIAERMVRRLERPPGISEVASVPPGRRSGRRGDHAAELLAAAVAERLALPFAPRRLETVRRTERQSGLPLSRREPNVRGAFRARGRCPKGILLVDDVATSGATARECARVLRRAGARDVAVWCFARASRHDPDPDAGPRPDPRAEGDLS